MSAGAFLAGCALLAWTLGACALATSRLVRPSGVVGAIGWATVFSALVALVHVVPLACGVLGRASVAVASAVVLACACWSGRRTPLGEEGESDGLGWPARVALVLVAGFAVASVTLTAGRPFGGLDALNFQLPQVARWIQTGTAWRLDQYIVDYSNATYPHTGNLMLLALTLPWRSTFAAGLATVPFYALAGVATHAAARELGAPARAAALGAAGLLAVPIVARVGLDGAMSDAPMLAWLAAGVLFLLRHSRTGARSDLVLAGVGLGLAFGSKWYALTAVPVVAGLWLVARRRPREALLLTGVIAATGGFWLLRNWVEAGNPLFPQPLLGLFPAPPDPLREQAGFSLAHYAFDLDVWRTYLRPAFAIFLGPPGLLLALGTVAAAVLAARRRDPRAGAVVVATLVLAAVYVVTPYSALGLEGAPAGAGVSTRYAIPALLGGALLLGWALGRARTSIQSRLRGTGWTFGAEVVVVLAVLDGLRRASDVVSDARWLAACAAAAIAALVWRARPARSLTRAVAVGLVATTVLLIAGDQLRRRANTTGYGATEPALAAVERAPGGVRVGLAGRWTNEGVSPVLPAFGPRLANPVAYVGPYVEGMLRRYPDPAAFRAALAAGRYELLVVGRADSLGAPAREEAWARAAGWREVVASPRLALLTAPEG